MATTEERLRILKMVQEGKISAEDAAHLIADLDERKARPTAPQPPQVGPSQAGRWFRVKVTDMSTGKTRVNVRLPIGLIDAGMKLGAHLSPDVQGLDSNQLKQLISAGGMGKIIDVFDSDDGEHVEVYIE